MCTTSTQFAVYAHFLILMMEQNRKKASKLIDVNSIEKKNMLWGERWSELWISRKSNKRKKTSTLIW